jgi:hypothetical protein
MAAIKKAGITRLSCVIDDSKTQQPRVAVSMVRLITIRGLEYSSAFKVQPGIKFVGHTNAAMNLNQLVRHIEQKFTGFRLG